MKAVVFFTTFSSKMDAGRFAKWVVKEKLAACVNILPGIESHYRWKGKVHNHREVLAIGKTTETGFKRIKGKLKDIHPYEVPELISLRIKDGSTKYLRWISDNVK